MQSKLDNAFYGLLWAVYMLKLCRNTFIITTSKLKLHKINFNRALGRLLAKKYSNWWQSPFPWSFDKLWHQRFTFREEILAWCREIIQIEISWYSRSIRSVQNQKGRLETTKGKYCYEIRKDRYQGKRSRDQEEDRPPIKQSLLQNIWIRLKN